MQGLISDFFFVNSGGNVGKAIQKTKSDDDECFGIAPSLKFKRLAIDELTLLFPFQLWAASVHMALPQPTPRASTLSF